MLNITLMRIISIIIIIIYITIITISIAMISYSDVFGPLWAPRLLNQGSMLLGPRPLMFLLARLRLGFELIGQVKALPGASLAWLVDGGAVGELRWYFASIEWCNKITVAKTNIMTIIMTNI